MNYHQRQYKLAYGRKRFFMPRFWIVSFLSAERKTQDSVVLFVAVVVALVSCYMIAGDSIDKTFEYHDQKAQHDSR